MAVTSSTTSVAFFANLFSPLMPIKSFGIFAGVIIPVNYVLVVTFLPTFITIYEKNLLFGKFCNKKVQKIQPAEGNIQEMSKTEKFFKNQWNNAIMKIKWQIVALTTIWCIFATYRAA